MFTTVAIQRFRAFRDLAIDSLDRVNLIVGRNNTGKTALLEAIFLLIGESNLNIAPIISSYRGLGRARGDPNEVSDWFWSPLFYRFKTSEEIRIQARDDDGIERRIQVRLVPRASARITLDQLSDRDGGSILKWLSSYALQIDYTNSVGEQRTGRMIIDEQGTRYEPPPPEPSILGYFQSSRSLPSPEDDARIYGMLEVVQEPYDVLRVLRIIEPRLTRVSTIAGAGGSILYGDIGIGRMIPLALMGDGLVRLMSLVVRIATAPRGVVLVDEFENGLHHEVLEPIWLAIAQAARQFDVQIIATTHSWECIQAAHRAFEASGRYDLGLYRLDRIDDDIRTIRYDRETLATSVDLGLEVR